MTYILLSFWTSGCSAFSLFLFWVSQMFLSGRLRRLKGRYSANYETWSNSCCFKIYSSSLKFQVLYTLSLSPKDFFWKHSSSWWRYFSSRSCISSTWCNQIWKWLLPCSWLYLDFKKRLSRRSCSFLSPCYSHHQKRLGFSRRTHNANCNWWTIGFSTPVPAVFWSLAHGGVYRNITCMDHHVVTSCSYNFILCIW